MQGVFHDAHEVYHKRTESERVWLATFASKALALAYVEHIAGPYWEALFELEEV